MQRLIIAAAVLAAFAAPALAEDNQAGLPLDPAEAAGPWTVEADGRDACVVTLGRERAAGGYAVRTSAACADILGAAPAAWRPTANGMALVAADGGPAIAFDRWSNSLLVSHRESGVDLQLRRGTAAG